jgi:hypothetical protein
LPGQRQACELASQESSGSERNNGGSEKRQHQHTKLDACDKSDEIKTGGLEMASQKQIEANRKNALKSTGATTPEGKAIVRFNSVTHGLTSEAAVIPFVENPEDWEAHREGIIESLSPVGHRETILTERIAMLIWRLGRANRYERELVAIEQERIEEKHFEYDNEYGSLENIQKT